MLLDAETLDLLPRAAEVVEAAADERFKLELPAAQLELTCPRRAPSRRRPPRWRRARRELAAAAAPSAGWPPPACTRSRRPVGELNRGDRYDADRREYGDIARRQLVCALQVHVAVGGADRSLAVYNGLRPWLPLIAALAANAPVPRRPRHRHGVHPPEDLRAAPAPGHAARDLARGRPSPTRSRGAPPPAPCPSRAAGGGSCARTPPTARSRCACPTPRPRSRDAAAVAALVHCLAAWLAERHDAGEPVARLRHLAARGEPLVGGPLGDGGRLRRPRHGARRPAREVLAALLETSPRSPSGSAAPRSSPACRAGGGQRRRAAACRRLAARGAAMARGRLRALRRVRIDGDRVLMPRLRAWRRELNAEQEMRHAGAHGPAANLAGRRAAGRRPHPRTRRSGITRSLLRDRHAIVRPSRRRVKA